MLEVSNTSTVIPIVGRMQIAAQTTTPFIDSKKFLSEEDYKFARGIDKKERARGTCKICNQKNLLIYFQKKNNYL